ncbi:hypothetical protein B0H14DRAFT_3124473 [Mycena olivaceomarginata]|nr:hypothetical protein B0H14DRAFT_3124473 [Mycena olivaceomarginata]
MGSTLPGGIGRAQARLYSCRVRQGLFEGMQIDVDESTITRTLRRRGYSFKKVRIYLSYRSPPQASISRAAIEQSQEKRDNYEATVGERTMTFSFDAVPNCNRGHHKICQCSGGHIRDIPPFSPDSELCLSAADVSAVSDPSALPLDGETVPEKQTGLHLAEYSSTVVSNINAPPQSCLVGQMLRKEDNYIWLNCKALKRKPMSPPKLNQDIQPGINCGGTFKTKIKQRSQGPQFFAALFKFRNLRDPSENQTISRPQNCVPKGNIGSPSGGPAGENLSTGRQTGWQRRKELCHRRERGCPRAQLEETKTKGELAAARKKLSKMGAKLVRLKGELSMVKTKLLDAHDSLVVAQKNVNALRSELPRECQDERKKKRTNERKQKRAEKMGRLTKNQFCIRVIHNHE